MFTSKRLRPGGSRALLGALVVTCLSPLAACDQIRDLTSSLTGSDEGSGAASRPAAGSGATAGTGAAAGSGAPAATPTAPSSAWQMLPANPEFAVRVDVAGLIAFANQQVGQPLLAAESLNADFALLLQQAQVPADIASRLLIGNTRELLVGVWSGEESALVITNVEAIANPPADGQMGTLTTGVQIGTRGGNVIIGVGPAFTRAWSMTGGDGAWHPETEWAEGFAHASSNSLISLLMTDFNRFPEATRGEITTSLNMTPSKAVVSLRADGSMIAAIDTADDAPIRSILGAAQAAYNQGITQLRSQAAVPQAVGAVNYLDLVGRAAWSQLRLTRTGTISTLQTQPAACGSSLITTFAALGAFGLGTDARAQFPNAPYVEMNQAIATDCAPMPGPAAAFPRDLARVVDFAAPGMAAIGLIDYGGLLRTHLPTGFGILPFALRPQDVVEAIGANPLGLTSLDQANAWIVASYADVGGMPNFFISVPDSLAAALPPGTTGGMPLTPVPGVGSVMAMPSADAALARTLDPASPLAAVLGAMPPAAPIVVAADQDAITAVMAFSPPGTLPPAVATAMGQVTAAAMSLDMLGGSVFAMHVNSGAQGVADAFNSAMMASLDQNMAQMGLSNPGQQALVRSIMQRFSQSFRYTAQGDNLVLFNLTSTGQGGSSALALTVMLGAIGAYTQQASLGGAGGSLGVSPELDLDTIANAAVADFSVERFTAAGKQEPFRFPRGFAMTPSQAEIQQACAMGMNGTMPSEAAWMVGPGALVPSTPTAVRYGIEYTSAGAGPGAQFTVRALADLDCDGVYATYERVGSAPGGFPTFVSSLPVNPGE